jgi:hypothetical protein
MSANATWFERSDSRFHHDNVGFGLGAAEIGISIAKALMNRKERAAWFLSVNYLTEMLRYTGRNGRFFDVLDDTLDHRYSDNHPTPGVYWGRAQELRAQADKLDASADNFPVCSEGCGDCRDLSEALRVHADHLYDCADSLQREGEVDSPLRGLFSLPTVKCWDRRVGADAIWYAPEERVFKFGGYRATPKVLGRLVALTLMRGDEWLTIGGFQLTVNYVLEMLRQTGKKGEFVDFTDDLFDPNTPTSTENRPVFFD